MATVSSIVSDNIPIFFECKTCDYKCSKKQHIEQHYQTTKHKTNFGNIVANSGNDTENNLCNCGKKYNDRSGLWKHKKICKIITAEIEIDKPKESQDLVTYLMAENKEFKNLLIEQNKTIIESMKHHSISNNNTINANNSNNKTFNLQVFLNEECKDAMNISDFMSSIQVQLEELECVGRLGFVEGISKIIIKNLKALDIRKRPVHCTDLKRETVYIKENGVWVKDDDSNTKLRKVIKNVSFRNSKNTRLYRDKYPDCVRSESRLSDIYSIIIIEAMGGGSNTDPKESEDKILRRILKELVFDKSRFLS
jgi:hypothetical protein